MLRNPFVVYIVQFGAVLGIYQLGWSEIYPPLSSELLIFFGATFLVALVLAWIISPAIESTNSYVPGLLPGWVGIFVIVTFAGEIALAGNIPLLLVAEGNKFFQLESTAAHLHAFPVWSVYSTIRFADFMYSRRKLYLIEAALPIIFYGLMVYRGPALICLVSWGFVFVIHHHGVRLRHIFLAVAAALSIFFANGLLGDIRSPGQHNVAVPSAAFRESGVPETYFWTYLYATVAMANLQLTVEKVKPPQGSIPEFVASELLPDTVSKRILPMLNPTIMSGDGNLASRDQLYSWSLPNVAQGQNIASIFGRAYGYFGWVGPAIMFGVLSIFIFSYLMLIAQSPYRVPCLALLNTLVVFCLFNNMIASAAMLPLLILPLLLPPWASIRRTANPGLS